MKFQYAAFELAHSITVRDLAPLKGYVMRATKGRRMAKPMTRPEMIRWLEAFIITRIPPDHMFKALRAIKRELEKDSK